MPQRDDEAPPSSQRNRPLYDVPYMFEAREFMRKKLIGKKVKTTKKLDFVISIYRKGSFGITLNKKMTCITFLIYYSVCNHKFVAFEVNLRVPVS